MWLAITGGIIVGLIGLAALYDYVARRRGRNESFGSHSGNPSFSAQNERNTLNP